MQDELALHTFVPTCSDPFGGHCCNLRAFISRPHPVKPMSSESQHPISTAAVKETKVRESTPRKVQVQTTRPTELGTCLINCQGVFKDTFVILVAL